MYIIFKLNNNVFQYILELLSSLTIGEYNGVKQYNYELCLAHRRVKTHRCSKNRKEEEENK